MSVVATGLLDGCCGWEIRFDVAVSRPGSTSEGGHILLRPNATSNWLHACSYDFSELTVQNWFGVFVSYSTWGDRIHNGYDVVCADNGGSAAACSRNCTVSAYIGRRRVQWKTFMTSAKAIPVVQPAYWSDHREFCTDDDFGTNEAFAVCRSAGFSPVAVGIEHVARETNNDVWLSNFSCPQGAQAIADCAMQYPVRSCASGRTVRLDCGVIPAWLIAVIVIAVALVLIAIAAGAVCFWYHNHRRAEAGVEAAAPAPVAASEHAATGDVELQEQADAGEAHRNMGDPGVDEGTTVAVGVVAVGVVANPSCSRVDPSTDPSPRFVEASEEEEGQEKRFPPPPAAAKGDVPDPDPHFSPKLADLVGHKADLRSFLLDAHVTTFRDLEDALVWAVPPGGGRTEAELLWKMRRIPDVVAPGSEATVHYLQHLRLTRRDQPHFSRLSDVPPRPRSPACRS